MRTKQPKTPKQFQAKQTKAERKAEVAEKNAAVMKPVNDWLAAHNARCCWATKEQFTGRRVLVECYDVGTKIIYVRWFIGREDEVEGWDILRSVCDENDTAKTLAAADAYINPNAKPDDLKTLPELGLPERVA